MAVVADLEAWWPKVRKGGLVAGHDYKDGLYLTPEEAVDPDPRGRAGGAVAADLWQALASDRRVRVPAAFLDARPAFGVRSAVLAWARARRRAVLLTLDDRRDEGHANQSPSWVMVK